MEVIMLSKRIRTIIRSVVLSLAIFIGSQFLGAMTVATPIMHPTASRPPVIMLDLAHRDTMNDCGADYLQWNERDIVNPITEKVAERLVNKGYSVTLTRNYDQPISINDRVALAARTDYDYYVSIHANSCQEANKGTGVESYYNGSAAKMMAEGMTKDLAAEFGVPNRGNFQSPYYTRRIHDSVLVEVGFINHDRDRQYMLENQDRIADIIANNIDIAYRNNLSQN